MSAASALQAGREARRGAVNTNGNCGLVVAHVPNELAEVRALAGSFRCSSRDRAQGGDVEATVRRAGQPTARLIVNSLRGDLRRSGRLRRARAAAARATRDEITGIVSDARERRLPSRSSRESAGERATARLSPSRSDLRARSFATLAEAVRSRPSIQRLADAVGRLKHFALRALGHRPGRGI